ncbi:DUF2625 domain-containing protein [Actinokineospora sp. UTMC 2448]|uniref:DUF2625 domain-containing protein n=1 Tax=Actinokineospora sp. UTMC 2448 TaxID=2268449 RepID=UPI002164EA2B|nr:DUF2625 domain-containing protein [Actinokineospora sp. UTMC 2448]UVS77754.1 hypothetical protein Actkin_01475 [Actinokineospora sp. UTMC 2448]
MTSAWDEVVAAIEGSPYGISVLPADPARARRCLSGLSITAKSWLGAVVAETGGLLVDHGWLRVLGSGTEALPDVFSDGSTIAYDVLGGQFAWMPNSEGRPTVHYFGPDDLSWVDLELGYADWLEAMLNGALDEFYRSLRWPGWQPEVAAIAPDHGLHTWPPPWSVEGHDLSRVSRKAVPLGELISLHYHAARQTGADCGSSRPARPDVGNFAH